MRAGEVLQLKVGNVDLNAGIVTIRDTKFRKDRLLPLPKSMTLRLRKYAAILGERAPEAYFFPAPDQGPYSTVTIYGIFRRLLRECGIPHHGRGKGPRLHELRHAFAIHTLERWYRQGENLEPNYRCFQLTSATETLPAHNDTCVSHRNSFQTSTLASRTLSVT